MSVVLDSLGMNLICHDLFTVYCFIYTVPFIHCWNFMFNVHKLMKFCSFYVFHIWSQPNMVYSNSYNGNVKLLCLNLSVNLWGCFSRQNKQAAQTQWSKTFQSVRSNLRSRWLWHRRSPPTQSIAPDDRPSYTQW
jgi:hypothetical protein